MGSWIRRQVRRAAYASTVWFALLACGELRAQPELVEAFIFGSRNLDCTTPNVADRPYTVVFHGTPQQLQYDANRGWGYEPVYADPGSRTYANPDRAGYGMFGPFDDSANNRGVFPDDCPNQIYDSFIGAKDFTVACSDPLDPETTCSDLGITPEGIVFRVDVPNGKYRFVGAFGSADNAHATRILAENGGEGPPANISDEYVTLVNNFDQGIYGTGTFARVAFGCVDVPEGNGPQFVNMDEDGFATDGPPESPTLEVTEGYIRIHQLQGNSTNDPNGGNAVLLEIWSVGDDPVGGGFKVGLDRTFAPNPRMPGDAVSVSLAVTNVQAPTVIEETIPEGWTVSDAGGGTVNANVITFNVDSDTDINYKLDSSNDCGNGEFSAHVLPEGGCEAFVAATLGCRPPDCGLLASGSPANLLIIGPIALEGDAGAACDDNGRLATTDYLADGETGETNILVEEFDELAPDFGGLSGGVGVALTPNLDINPDGALGVLTVFRADADLEGRVNLNDADNFGDPVDDYVVYAVTYLDNTTGECLDAVLEVGSDDAVKVLVNGGVVHVNSVCRGIPAYGAGDRVPVTFAPGVNIVVAAVVENGGGTDVRLAVRDLDDSPLTDGRLTASCTPPDEYPAFATIVRSFASSAPAGSELEVTLDATNIPGATTLEETFPMGLEVVDAGGGTVNGNTIAFDIAQDSQITYTLLLPSECDEISGTFSAALTVTGGCGSVGGQSTFTCTGRICPPNPDAPDSELIAAFNFSAAGTICETPNEPGLPYTSVAQTSAFDLEYDEARGWGYEVLYPDPNNQPYGARNGYGVFGPFDDSPNNRGSFAGLGCPEDLYGSFIGGKDFATTPCTQADFNPPDPNAPCDPPEGIIFRVDVPNGFYRFVAAVGDAENEHAHRILVENGGEGPPQDISDEHVVLVGNFDQTQYAIGDANAGCLGCGVFARVGFDDKIPPVGDGVPPSPQFVNFDRDGNPTTDCPDSPVLEVTEGYIRVHQLQGNSNAGPGGTADPNGGDMILLELWQVEEDGGGPVFLRGNADGVGAINITDGVFVLNYLFTGGGDPPCKDAADADDSGVINITDGVYILNFLFTGGADPRPPFPNCGTDPTDDSVDCLTSDASCN